MTTTDRKILLAFLAVSLILRLACLNLNSAEYTDGIFQITAFERGFTFWPPVYTIATKACALATRDLELAAKLVSILSSALVLIPLFGLTLRLAGRRAAIYAALFYLANPIAGRWGIRVMSDSLFALLFFWATVLFLRILEWQRRRETAGGEGDLIPPPVNALVAASVMAPLATLTRYQGILLLPLQWLALRAILSRRGSIQPSNKFTVIVTPILAWLVALGWLTTHVAIHQKQIAQRAGPWLAQAFVNYWQLAESFILLFPYFVTIPIFVLFAIGLGLSLAGDRNRQVFAWAFLAFAAVVLAMQSVFAAFQERYLLPLVPFMMTLAGIAASRWEEGARRRPAVVRAVLVLILLYCFAWTSAVLFRQRETFGDIKQAAQYCAKLPPQARIFSNEWFGGDQPAVKMSFWSGRPVQGWDGSQSLTRGDYLCLHSGIYGQSAPYPALGPSPRFQEQLEAVRARYDCKEIERFYARTVPLLPDIMDSRDTHTSPLAWFFRYSPQRFCTVTLKIEGPRSAR